MNDTIGPVRPIFNIDEINGKKKVERLLAGGKSAGIVIDITQDGLEMNGYYTGFDNNTTKYANMLTPVQLSWEELEKIKIRLTTKPKKKVISDSIERDVDLNYLKTLPQVTIGDQKYYIDASKRERRAVSNPERVTHF